MQANLERDTGRTLDAWVAIAKTCPEIKPRARALWLKDNYGLLQNRAMHVLSVAFPTDVGWQEADTLREALWPDPASRAIFEAVQDAASAFPDVVMGQRKAFTAFSRAFQFAAVKPIKGGKASLGLALTPDADPRLEAPKNESWSERLKSKFLLNDRHAVEPSMKAAWEGS